LDEMVREKDGGGVDELAFVLLGKGFGIREAAAEEIEVERKSVSNGVVDGDFVGGEIGVEPETMEEIGLAVGCGDDTKFFSPAVKRVADDGKNGAPDIFGSFMESEFGEDEVGGIAAEGLGFCGECCETGAVGEAEFAGLE
jgi:hypothetical protein